MADKRCFVLSSSGMRRLWRRREKPFLFRALWPLASRQAIPVFMPEGAEFNC